VIVVPAGTPPVISQENPVYGAFTWTVVDALSPLRTKGDIGEIVIDGSAWQRSVGVWKKLPPRHDAVPVRELSTTALSLD
jgi:hypothetical protein